MITTRELKLWLNTNNYLFEEFEDSIEVYDCAYIYTKEQKFELIDAEVNTRDYTCFVSKLIEYNLTPVSQRGTELFYVQSKIPGRDNCKLRLAYDKDYSLHLTWLDGEEFSKEELEDLPNHVWAMIDCGGLVIKEVDNG